MPRKRDEAPADTPRLSRGLGYQKDDPDERDYRARALFGARRGLPGEAMALEACVPGIRDQLWTNSCVGQAIATAIDTRLRSIGRWNAPLTSASAVYQLARILERLSKEAPLEDRGCYPRLAMRAIREWGAPPEATWPFDAARVNDEPPIDVLQAASTARVSAWWRIDSSGSERVEDVCQALSAGYPVVFGTDVDRRFLEHSGKDPVGAMDPLAIQGGHMMCFVGYTTQASRRVLRAVNSWGLSWGDSGMFWAAEEFVTDVGMGDIYVLQVAAG